MRIERFDPSIHDRTQFASGIPAVDNFFARTANKLQRADNLRVFVLLADNGDLLGFHALNAASMDYRDLPRQFARARPSHGTIPVAFVAMMGIGAQHQGKRLGKILLSDVCTRAARAAEDLGLAAIVLDVLDCGDEERVRRRRSFYDSFGFQSLPTNPMRMYLPLSSAISTI